MDCSLLPPVSASPPDERALQGRLLIASVRKFFIIHVARELNLVFPTATAAAVTIRSMHTIGGDASVNAKKRTRALAISFVFCLVFRVGASYAPGVLWDWHIFSWFYQVCWCTRSSWGMDANLLRSGATIPMPPWLSRTGDGSSSGRLLSLGPACSSVSTRPSRSLEVVLLRGVSGAPGWWKCSRCGGLTTTGIIGPALVRNGSAYGVSYFTPVDPQYEHWGGLVSFMSLNLEDPKNMPSPRYWMLWP